VEIIIDSRSLIMEHNHIVPGHFAERKVARSFSFDDVFRLLLKNGFRPKKHGDLSVVFFCGENVITLKTTRDPITFAFFSFSPPGGGAGRGCVCLSFSLLRNTHRGPDKPDL
jgi:hypothetical protein